LSDNSRIVSIKTDPVVNKSQLYGQPDVNWVLPAFTKTYVADNVPQLIDMTMRSNGRERYVFALEPRVDKDGKRMLEAKPYEGAKVNLDAEGYIGNLGTSLSIVHPFFD
jgi:hypothetical protein